MVGFVTLRVRPKVDLGKPLLEGGAKKDLNPHQP
jgi:hypothetical protein